MGLIALVAVGGAAVGFLVLGDGGGGITAAGELFLEPIDAEGPDPFTAPVAERPSSDLRDFAAEVEDGEAPAVGTEVGDTPSRMSGSEPGLYGGTQQEGSCDPEQLVDFLEANADKAAAFARVLGVEPDEIADYVDDLTPVFLTEDTRVTNHGFRNGRATPRQAVLQRGTAVMVDDHGIPRVKCFCGNPLLPPELIPERAPITGETWRGYDPGTVVSVTAASQTINVFVLIDIETGELFERPAGTTGDEDEEEEPEEPELGTGDVQITLRWNTHDDLDLHVTDPAGEEINFSSRTSSSGGELDVDANAGCPGSSSGVENIFWPPGGAPRGQYVVAVNFFGSCNGSGSVSFTVEVRVDGSLRETITGSITEDETREVYRFVR